MSIHRGSGQDVGNELVDGNEKMGGHLRSTEQPSNAEFTRSIQGKPKIEVHEPVLKAVKRCIVRSNVPFAYSSNERRVQIVEHGEPLEQRSRGEVSSEQPQRYKVSQYTPSRHVNSISSVQFRKILTPGCYVRPYSSYRRLVSVLAQPADSDIS